jgi:hypothetical protein
LPGSIRRTISSFMATINVALGNENGMVVLTDSMLTAGARQRPDPGQKLFKSDDRTACSLAVLFLPPLFQHLLRHLQ